ncbi:hypothetical protein J6590_043815 [Homalodisca vitripennis]|nr:hypothetical protein J6590_043815 [Homalodisca vitripennis]
MSNWESQCLARPGQATCTLREYDSPGNTLTIDCMSNRIYRDPLAEESGVTQVNSPASGEASGSFGAGSVQGPATRLPPAFPRVSAVGDLAPPLN